MITEFIKELITGSGATIGYFLIYAIIFAESGLFFGFFLPGDSLLFMLGLFATQGIFNYWTLLFIGILAAITGDSVGYIFGRRVGPAIFNKPDSRFFKQENIQKAHEFYERHGKMTIILARFTPIVRTFAPIVAGVAEMHYPTFLAYNVIGGAGWITAMLTAGYFLGNAIPNIDKFILPIVVVIVIVSVIPMYMEIRKDKKSKKK